MMCRNILVIEDDPAFMGLLRAFFARVLPDARVSYSEWLPKDVVLNSFDLILCDLHLPDARPEEVFALMSTVVDECMLVFMSADVNEIALLKTFFKGDYRLYQKDRVMFSKLECLLSDLAGATA